MSTVLVRSNFDSAEAWEQAKAAARSGNSKPRRRTIPTPGQTSSVPVVVAEFKLFQVCVWCAEVTRSREHLATCGKGREHYASVADREAAKQEAYRLNHPDLLTDAEINEIAASQREFEVITQEFDGLIEVDDLDDLDDPEVTDALLGHPSNGVTLCSATTKAGRPCKNQPQAGSDKCGPHNKVAS